MPRRRVRLRLNLPYTLSQAKATRADPGARAWESASAARIVPGSVSPTTVGVEYDTAFGATMKRN